MEQAIVPSSCLVVCIALLAMIACEAKRPLPAKQSAPELPRIANEPSAPYAANLVSECSSIGPLPKLGAYSYFKSLPATFEALEPLFQKSIAFADSKAGETVEFYVECRCSVCRLEHGAETLASANMWVGAFQEEFLRQAAAKDVEYRRFRMTNETGSSIDAPVELVVYVDYAKR